MEGGENMDKADWTKDMLHTFCDICIRAIELGMQHTMYFDKTGHSLTKAQLKNKWDGCKKDWKIWMKLISEIGVGWSSELGTIVATNEWWKAKSQEVKGAKKFRHAGIESTLKFKYDRMYSSIVAIEEYAWAPSSGVQGGGNCSQPGTNNANIDAVDLEEGSSDSEEDRNPASNNDIAQLVGGVNISSSNNTQTSGKGKEMEAAEGRTMKKKSKNSASIGVQLMSKWGELVDSMSTRSDSASLHMDKQGCSIHEVMAEIHSIPGIRADIDFHDFALECMLQRRRREMWATMGSLEENYDWMKQMHTVLNKIN
uniref:Myb/SANT-like domain-containing protein n=1 Tax=Salix viminalis TaxID=40686 RepID=A0A6N2KT01_SALVM